jgi:hypothetical protein
MPNNRIYIEDFLKKGKWTRKSRIEYTELILSNENYFRTYTGDELESDKFVRSLLKHLQCNNLTSKYIAKKLNVCRFTYYSIKDNKRKLKRKEKDILFNMTLESEFDLVALYFYKERARTIDSDIKAVNRKLHLLYQNLLNLQLTINKYKSIGIDVKSYDAMLTNENRNRKVLEQSINRLTKELENINEIQHYYKSKIDRMNEKGIWVY